MFVPIKVKIIIDRHRLGEEIEEQAVSETFLRFSWPWPWPWRQCNRENTAGSRQQPAAPACSERRLDFGPSFLRAPQFIFSPVRHYTVVYCGCIRVENEPSIKWCCTTHRIVPLEALGQSLDHHAGPNKSVERDARRTTSSSHATWSATSSSRRRFRVNDCIQRCVSVRNGGGRNGSKSMGCNR